MSSEPKNPDQSADQSDPAPAEEPDPDDASGSQRLTIALPDGSESVSDAIVAHREMLIEPREHGLATDEQITHLSEAMETLSEDVEDVDRRQDDAESRAAELEREVERQRAQIDELQSVVTSLVEILGTETEWETFEDV